MVVVAAYIALRHRLRGREEYIIFAESRRGWYAWQMDARTLVAAVPSWGWPRHSITS